MKVLPDISPLRHSPGSSDIHDVRLDDDVEDAHPGLHGVGVELAHVGAAVLQLGLGDVEHPLASCVIVTHGDTVIVGDHMGPDGLDRFTVGLHPAHSMSLKKRWYISFNKPSFQTTSVVHLAL